MKKYEDVLIKIDYLFECYSLDEENLLAFLYDKAESLFELKRKNEALNCFGKIVKIRPGYRLARERMNAIIES